MERGCFIVFEGLDGVGKTTQCAKLVEAIPNAVGKRFPNTDSEFGKMLPSKLCADLPFHNHILFSEQRRHDKPDMVKTLESGTNIICDRYSHSGIAYTLAIAEFYNDTSYDESWVHAREDDLIAPDLVIYMDADPVILSKRPGWGDGANETLDIQKKVWEQYMPLVEDDWLIIDGTEPVDEIFEKIKARVLETIEANKNTPLKYLTNKL